MPQPYHSSTTYTVTGATTGIDDSVLIDRLNDIITGLQNSSSKFTEEDLIGKSSLSDGGLLGGIFRLLRVHVNEMVDNNEIIEADIAAVLSGLMTEGMKTGIGYVASQKESEIKSLGLKAEIIASLIKTSSEKVKLFTAIEESKITEFNLKYLLPRQVQEIEEKIELSHVQHEEEKYKLDFILPADKDIKIEQKNELIAKTSIEAYERASMLPAKLTNLTAQTTETGARTTDINAKTALTNKEKDIKTYYNTNIQPYETDQAHAKALVDQGTAGLIAGHSDNMGVVKTEQLIAQTALYTRQESMYDDKKYMEIFKIQMNYQTLIFADLGPNHVIEAANNQSLANVYNELTPVAFNVTGDNNVTP